MSFISRQVSDEFETLDMDIFPLHMLLDKYSAEEDNANLEKIMSNTKCKKGIAYIPVSNFIKFAGEEMYSNLIAESLVPKDNVECTNKNIIMGYTCLTNNNFRGNIIKIGTVEGTDLKGFSNNVDIYNYPISDIIGFIPVVKSFDIEINSFEDLFDRNKINYIAVSKLRRNKWYWILYGIVGTIVTIEYLYHMFL